MQKSIFKNALYKITLNIFNVILPLLVGPYAYRTLGADSMGTVNLADTIFNYFYIFAVFGIYQYGLREISLVKTDKKKVNQLFTSLYLINLLTSALALGAYLLFSYVGYGDNELFPVLLIFSLNFISNIFYVEWVNEALENYQFIAIKTIFVRITYVILLFVFVQSSNDYKQFAALLVLSTFLNYIISFVYIKRRIKFDFSNIAIKRHLKPLFVVVIFSNASILYTQLDRFMLGEYLGKASLSFYVMSFQMMVIIHTLMVSIIQVTIPRLSYLSGNTDEKTYETLLDKISQVYFITLFPAAIGLMLIAHPAVIIYGGEEFAGAGDTLFVFAFYMIAIGIESILSNQIIYVKKKEHILVRLLFICGFINLILNFSLLYFNVFSPATATLSTTIAYCILISFEYIYVKKHLKVNYTLFDFKKLKYLLYSLVFIPLTMIIHSLVSHLIISVILTILVCSLSYALILFVTKDDILFLFLQKIKFKRT